LGGGDNRTEESAMTELILGGAIGGALSWCIAYIYHHKASTEIPDWAKPIVERLPPSRPPEAELLKLFQQALNTGEVVPDPLLGHVACPECKAPGSDFQEESFGDEYLTLIVKSCPHCGWSEDAIR